MTDWVLIPCLERLRGEYNAVSPQRDKGADGAIGDARHSPSSDHSPDEDSVVLRARDADSRNEVHALDIDSTGPWPHPGWFDASVEHIVNQQRTDGDRCRLEYVIWNRHIASREHGWAWRPYTGTDDPHLNHAHFSGRYTAGAEADTRPWHLEDLMALTTDDKRWIENLFARGVQDDKKSVTSRIGRDALDQGVPNPISGGKTAAWKLLGDIAAQAKAANTAVVALATKDVVDEQALAAAVAAVIVPALPTGGEVTAEQLQTAIVGALRELATEK